MRTITGIKNIKIYFIVTAILFIAINAIFYILRILDNSTFRYSPMEQVKEWGSKNSEGSLNIKVKLKDSEGNWNPKLKEAAKEVLHNW